MPTVIIVTGKYNPSISSVDKEILEMCNYDACALVGVPFDSPIPPTETGERTDLSTFRRFSAIVKCVRYTPERWESSGFETRPLWT
jgi:hypothetical protein